MKRAKRTLSILLALLMLVGLLPMNLTVNAITVINSVSVDVMAPMAGRYPSYEPKVNTAGVVLDVEDNTYGECQKNGVIWFCGDTPMLPEEAFEVGKVYTVRVQVLNESMAYTFRTSPSPELTVNGKAGWCQFGIANFLSIEYTFPVLEGYTVSFAANGGAGTMAPITGVAGIYSVPACTFTAPSGKVFKSWKVGNEEWWPGENYLIDGDVTFIAQWKTQSSRVQVSDVVATSEDIDSIPTLYGLMRIPQFTITQGAPAYISASTGNLRWQKKEGGEWKYTDATRFTPGEWRVATQVRIDRNDGYLTHELGGPFTLTVNGKTWLSDNNGSPYVEPTYSMIFVYSPTYVIENNPNVQPPVAIEQVSLSLDGYHHGSEVKDAKVFTEAPIHLTQVAFAEVTGDLNLNPEIVMVTNGTFSYQKSYVVFVEFSASKGYDLYGLTRFDVVLEQADLCMSGRYDVETDAFKAVYLLKPATLPEKVALNSPLKGAQVKEGEIAKVVADAVGDGLTYTWYIKNKGAKTYSKSSIKTNTYSVKMSSTSRDRSLYCVIKDKNGISVTSNTVALRMAATITKQPTTAFAKRNATAKVTLTAAGDGLTYQWYVKNPGATEYVVSSVKSATYSAKMTEQNSGRLVYCVVTDKYGHTAQTKTVVMRMQATIVTQPKSATVKNGTTAKATVKAAGDGLTYTWYIKNKGAKSFTKSSVKTNTYTVKMSSTVNGRQVYCVVKDKYGKTVKSSTVTLKKK